MLNRRQFLLHSAVCATAGVGASSLIAGPGGATLAKAVVFDAFPIFDPRPVFALAEDLFPGKGAALANAWRTRQFEYQWLRALSQKYAPFDQVTEDALVFAAEATRVELGAEQRKKLVEAYAELKAWPEVAESLKTLKNMGLELAFLSNMTRRMLESNIRSAKLEGLFDHVLSTDSTKTYKPDPRAYQLGTTSLNVSVEQVIFVAFAGWDVAGAKSFGYPTFWVNRMKQPPEQLGVMPDGTGVTLEDLVAFVKRGR